MIRAVRAPGHLSGFFNAFNRNGHTTRITVESDKTRIQKAVIGEAQGRQTSHMHTAPTMPW